MSTIAAQGVGTRRMGREEIVRLGAAGRPWDFVPIATQALRIAPGDAGIRVLLAANLARLGLRTAAAGTLDGLAEQEQGHPSVGGLRAALAALPEDRIAPERLERTCRGNVEALGARAGELVPLLPSWVERMRERAWFAASDGNVVRWRADGSWEHWGDHRGAAARFGDEHLPAGKAVRALTVEGADPPWLLLEVLRRLARQSNGGWPRVNLIQRDALGLLDGLACADLREAIAPERLRVFAGGAATERLAEELRSRYDSMVTSAFVPLVGMHRRAEPRAEAVLARAEAEQRALQERLLAEVRAIYQGRDRAWWARRYREAREGVGTALRVLVPTCRYSTFIKHASADLVEALAGAGYEAELMIEPDDSTQFSAVAYLRRLAEFRPDLVVLINYTRGQLGEFFPREVPFVTWVQDALATQLDRAVGAGLGGMDFLVGNLYAELFSVFGYPRERTLHRPVVASASKFHPGPAPEPLRDRFACEVALVSHQSETAEAIHARLRREAGADPTTLRILDGLRGPALAIAEDPMAGPIQTRLEEATRAVVSGVLGREADPELVARLVRQYALPVADPAIRHQTLAWAAEICARRGWRLRIYGRGWERHPTLAPFAAGEVAHGEELRACYQAAAAHLHASINTLMHQRVMECALSGGVPLCRLQREAIGDLWWAARREAVVRGSPSWRDEQGRVCFAIADDPGLMMAAAQTSALGIAMDPCAAVLERQIPALRAPESADRVWMHPAWLLGDLSEMTFRSGAELERGLERAIESPAWRRAASEAIAGRVRARLSHRALVGEIVALVTRGLEG